MATLSAINTTMVNATEPIPSTTSAFFTTNTFSSTRSFHIINSSIQLTTNVPIASNAVEIAIEDDANGIDLLLEFGSGWLYLLILLLITYTCIVPTSIWLSYKYYQRIYEDTIQMRRPVLVLITNGIMVFMLCIHIPLYTLVFSFGYPQNQRQFQYAETYRSFGVCLTSLTFWIRAWHTYFDYHLHQATIDRVWNKAFGIASQEKFCLCGKGNFFIRFAKTWGQPRFTITVAIQLLILTTILPMFSTYYFFFVCQH